MNKFMVIKEKRFVIGLSVLLLLIPLTSFNANQLVTENNDQPRMINLDRLISINDVNQNTYVNSIEQITEPSTSVSPPKLSVTESFFPEPTVEILRMTDHELSLFGYGNDTIRFNMEFKPKFSADYYGYARLYRNESGTLTAIGLDGEAYWSDYVEGDHSTIAFWDLCAYEVANNYDGPFVIKLRFYKNNGSTYNIFSDYTNFEYLYTTQAYQATNFAENSVSVDETSFTITRIDNDGNSKYDWIKVSVDIDFTVPTNYHLQGRLYTADGEWAEDYCSLYTSFDSGTHTIDFLFPGWKFNSTGINSAFNFDLLINYNTQPYYYLYNKVNVFTSSVYQGSEFDSLPFEFTGRSWSYPYDSDSDGLYDYLNVILEVNFTRIEYPAESRLTLWADLYYDNTSSTIHIVNDYGSFDGSSSLDSLRLVNVTFSFNGISIYQSGIINKTLLVSNVYGYISYRSYGDDWEDDYVSGISSKKWIIQELYSYDQFQSPGAYLTDNYSDYPVDTDGDGLYNEIIVEVEVKATAAGEYKVYAYFETLNDYQNFAWESESKYLTPGTYQFQLHIDGVDIYEKGINDTIVIDSVSLYKYDPYTQIDYNGSINLGHYNFLDFDPPKGKFTGIYSDQVYDSNGDGYYDELRIYVEVEINDNGSYRVEGRLENVLNNQGTYANSEIQNCYVINSSGTFSFLLKFSGNWIWQQRTNSTYRLDYVYLYETDSDGYTIRNWDYENDPFTTNTIYDSNDFQPSEGQFTGTIIENTTDTDGDGQFNYLILSVEIVTTTDLSIRLYGWMNTGAGSIASENYTYDLVAGTYYIDLRFKTDILYKAGGNNSYEVYLTLTRTDNWNTLDQFEYDTKYYHYSIWDPPKAFLTGNIYDKGVDTDGNGLFNFVKVSIEINVTEAGEYRVYCELYNGKSYYGFWGEKYVELDVGIHNLSISIKHTYFLIGDNGSNQYINSYRLSIKYEDGSTQDYWHYDEYYFEEEYYFNVFEPFSVAPTGVLWDYGVDENNNSLFDYIEFAIEVNVTKAGRYYLYGRVSQEDSANNYYFSSSYYDLDVGLYNFTFKISKNWLLSSYNENDSLYVKYIYIYEYNETSSSTDLVYKDYDFNVYFNNTYQFKQFDGPEAIFVGIVGYETPDYNNDGLYDCLIITITINITVNNLDLAINLYLREYSTNDWIGSYYYYSYGLSVGVFNWSCSINGYDLYSNGFTEGIIISELRLIRTNDGYWEDISSQSDVYTMTDLSYDDFTNFSVAFGIVSTIIDIQSDGNIYVQVLIVKYTDEGISWVELIPNTYDSWSMNYMSSFDNMENYSLTFNPPDGTTSFTIVIHGWWGNSYSETYQLIGPVIIEFYANSTTISPGTGVLFTTVIQSDYDLASVNLTIGTTVLGMNQVSFDNVSLEYTWTREYLFTDFGEYSCFITATDINGTSVSSYVIVISVKETIPIIESFSLNISSVAKGGAIKFTAVVSDPDGIASVTLYVAGSSYAMNLTAKTGSNETWEVIVTFNTLGQFTAYIVVVDNSGSEETSITKNVYVNEGQPDIISISITPGTTVTAGTEITFTMVIRKSDSLITSVTLIITGDYEGSFALERTSENETTETYSVSYTPTVAGTYYCELRVLNTRNQVAIFEEIITVTGNDELGIASTPGFELIALLSLVVILPVIKKKRK